MEAARNLLADLELELKYGIEKSKVDSVRSKLFAALRASCQEGDHSRQSVEFRKGSTRALTCGFQRPR